MNAAERQRHRAWGFNPRSEATKQGALKGRRQLNCQKDDQGRADVTGGVHAGGQTGSPLTSEDKRREGWQQDHFEVGTESGDDGEKDEIGFAVLLPMRIDGVFGVMTECELPRFDLTLRWILG
jgi:hypothetical protein